MCWKCSRRSTGPATFVNCRISSNAPWFSRRIGAAPSADGSETDDEAAFGRGLAHPCGRRAEPILDVLKQADGQIGGQHGAATRLGLPRTTLLYKMRKLGIEARRSHRARPVQQKHNGDAPLAARPEPVALEFRRFEAVASV